MSKLTMAELTEQPLTEEEAEIVKTAYKYIELFEEGDRPFHDAAKEAREILRLRDPHQDSPGAKKPTLQLQTLKSTINNCVADQMQNLPEAKLLPEVPDKENQAMDLQDLLHYVIYITNNYEELHRRRAEDLYTTGTAITQVVWDPDMRGGQGDIALIRWPVEAFLWDPNAEDIQDGRACVKCSWHPLSWFREHFPKLGGYVKGEDGEHGNVGLPTSQANQTSGEETRAMLAEYWWREYDASSKRYKINVAYLAGGALLYHRENVYRHGLYPFVVDVHSPVEGSMAGDGLVQELTPMMRYINRYAAYIDANLRMSSKGRIIVRKNSGIDREAFADWEQDIVEGDAVEQGPDWNWIQNAPFNGMITQMMLEMENELKMDSGANQYSRGESLAGVTSGKMLAALQTAGGKISSLRTETLNIGFRKMVEQILWLMSQLYTEDRSVVITGRSGSVKTLEARAAKYFGTEGPPPFLVQVEINKRNPAQIEAQNEMFMQAYTMAAQAQQYFPLSALFQMLNVDGKDRLLPVIRENEHYMEQMQALRQQNEQMIGQLEQLQKEKESLSATATQLANTLASVKAGGGVAAQPQKLAGAGQQPDQVAQAREVLAGNAETPAYRGENTAALPPADARGGIVTM